MDTISLPVLLSFDRNRYKLTIDTGKTGPCRLLVYVPKDFDEKPRGVVMHLHGGGWTMFVSLPSQPFAVIQPFFKIDLGPNASHLFVVILQIMSVSL